MDAVAGIDTASARPWRLHEFVASREGERFIVLMERLLESPVRVLDEHEQVLRGGSSAPLRSRVSLRVQVEPVGYLEADARAERTAGAARILEALLRSEGHYRAASRLHLEAVRRDYEELKRKHEALLDSETRYRDLAAQLDERVKSQVRTIEATQRRLYQSEKWRRSASWLQASPTR